MIRSEFYDAACMWLEHQRWEVAEAFEIGGTDDEFDAVEITATKENQSKVFMVLQHRFWFDPLDFVFSGDSEANHFRVPKYGPLDDTKRAILCFNRCRAYAVFVPEFAERRCGFLETTRDWVHREDLNCLAVPWRIWALDEIPEWLQRGWPNPRLEAQGTVGKKDDWQFHPSWCVEVMKHAEAYQRLPTRLEDSTDFQLKSKKWYRAFLETGDDLILPWAE